MIALTLLGMIVGGPAFRLRGDALIGEMVGGSASHLGRLVWALPITLIALAASGWNPKMAFLAPALFLGAMPGWYDGISISVHRPREIPKHLAIMAARGLAWTLPAAPVLWWAGAHWQFALAGIVAGPIYLLASVVDEDCQIGPLWISDHDGWVNIPLGEILFGIVAGGAIVIGAYQG